MTSYRHFKALSRKNWINWKRTPLGSATEIICPILLMIIMVRIRRIIDPELSPALKLAELRHPLFQPAKPDPISGVFNITS